MHDKEKETLEVECKSKIDARTAGLKKFAEVNCKFINRSKKNVFFYPDQFSGVHRFTEMF